MGPSQDMTTGSMWCSWVTGDDNFDHTIIVFSNSFTTVIYKIHQSSSVQSLSSVRFFCDPMDCSTPGLPVHHQLPEFTQLIELVTPSNHLILCRPLLLLLSIFPSIMFFSNESVLHIRWPKYCSFSIRHQSFQ